MTLRANKSFYLTALIILVIAGAVVFIFFPYQKKNQEILKTLNEKRVDLTLLKDQVRKIGVVDNTDKLAQTEKQLNSYLIDKSDILQFISTLEDIAQKHSLDIDIDLNEFPDDKTALIIDQPISLTVDGNYARVVDFLTELEAQEYYLSFQKFNVSASTGQAADKTPDAIKSLPTAQTLRLTLAGTSYWR